MPATRTLSAAQRNLLGRCATAMGGTCYLATRDRVTAISLDRRGLAHYVARPRRTGAYPTPAYAYATITPAGREALG